MKPEPRRLARALLLAVEQLDGKSWRVTGGSRVHIVRNGICDCEDAAIRRAQCKHYLAVRLARLDADVRIVLRTLVHPTHRTPSPTTPAGKARQHKEFTSGRAMTVEPAVEHGGFSDDA